MAAQLSGFLSDVLMTYRLFQRDQEKCMNPIIFPSKHMKNHRSFIGPKRKFLPKAGSYKMSSVPLLQENKLKIVCLCTKMGSTSMKL